MRSDFKDIVIVVILWIVFAAMGFAVMEIFAPFPVAAAEEAHLVDEAFTILTRFSVPVFTFVIAVLTYSAFRFRRKGEPTGGLEDDGPPVRSHKPLILAWFGATTALTLVLIIFPGITGILDLRNLDRQPADLVIQVEGRRFFWKATYLDSGVVVQRVTEELVLPKDAHVRFNITSHDVLHSFWIPAFRIKIDAVPGMFTTTAATPTKLGSFEGDANFRLQCAEMCGSGHNAMRLRVRVVEPDEFEDWISQKLAARR